VITKTIASEPSQLKAATARGIEQAVMLIVDIRANWKIRQEQPSTTNNNTPGGKYSPSDISALCKQWFERCSDLLGPILLELPPFREVNHRILLIDENLRYNYHLPRCPEALQEEL
jgi:hypothetical protein